MILPSETMPTVAAGSYRTQCALCGGPLGTGDNPDECRACLRLHRVRVRHFVAALIERRES